MWAALVAQLVPGMVQQRNNTNAHSYVMPESPSQTPFYLTIIAVLIVMGVVGYVLFNKK